MHELPRTALVSKDARGAERDRRHVLAASHPRPQALDLDQEREICRHLFRYEIEPHGLPVPIERGGMLHGVHNLFESTHKGAERVSKGHVVLSGPELRQRLMIPPREGIQCAMILLNHLIEVRRRHRSTSAPGIAEDSDGAGPQQSDIQMRHLRGTVDRLQTRPLCTLDATRLSPRRHPPTTVLMS